MIYEDKVRGIICVSSKLTEEEVKKAIPFVRRCSNRGITLYYFDLDELKDKIEKELDKTPEGKELKISAYQIAMRLFCGESPEEISEGKIGKAGIDRRIKNTLDELWGQYNKKQRINDIQIKANEYLVRDIFIYEIRGLQDLFYEVTRNDKLIRLSTLQEWLDNLSENNNEGVIKIREKVEEYCKERDKRREKLSSFGLVETMEEVDKTEESSRDITIYDPTRADPMSIHILNLPFRIYIKFKRYCIDNIEWFSGKTRYDLGQIFDRPREALETLSILKENGIVLNEDGKLVLPSKIAVVPRQTHELREIVKNSSPEALPPEIEETFNLFIKLPSDKQALVSKLIKTLSEQQKS